MKKCIFVLGITLFLLVTATVSYAEDEPGEILVSYFVSGELVEIREYRDGDTVYSPMIACKDGYAITSWYTESGERFDFSSPIEESIKLFADPTLLPAAVRVDALEFTYDGEEHPLKIASVYHPLESEGGYYRFEWYQEGELIGDGERIYVSDVSDSGEYMLKASFCLGDETSSIVYDNIFVEVKPKAITPPVIETLTYTGELVTPTVPESPYYEFEKIFVKNSGNYYLTLTLSDKENYCWLGTDSASVSVAFSVVPDSSVQEDSFNDIDVRKTNLTGLGALLFLLSLLFAGGALTLIIIARKNTDRLVAASSINTLENKDDDLCDFDYEPELSIQLCESDGDFKFVKISAERADALLSDISARGLLKYSDETFFTRGMKRADVSLGIISDSFYPGECVNLESLLEQGLINSDVGYVNIVEDGELDKPLKIYANEFSLTALKMIVLSGGEAYKCQAKK